MPKVKHTNERSNAPTGVPDLISTKGLLQYHRTGRVIFGTQVIQVYLGSLVTKYEDK